MQQAFQELRARLFFVPEGHLRIAQCFSIGFYRGRVLSPEGTAEERPQFRPSLRDLSILVPSTQR